MANPFADPAVAVSQVEAVSGPGTLAQVGAGLAALGAGLRRRRSRA